MTSGTLPPWLKTMGDTFVYSEAGGDIIYSEMLCNSYSLDIKSGTGTRYQSTGGDTRRTSTRAVAERETSTLDSGMGNTMEFRRYPKEETIASIDSGVTVREMREKRRQVKEEYQVHLEGLRG